MTTIHRVPGAILTEREHTVPLDHGDAGGPAITVFTRELSAPGGEERPYLLFLQGGPGMEATRPTSPPSGWMKRAIQDYRVLLIDQRGTGRSTPVGRVLQGETPEAQTEYLTHFRADSIVRDAEAIRQELGVGRWSVLGQSFGGFCAMTYLSFAPEGLREAFITGGLSPIARPLDDVYSATYRRVAQRTGLYFQRYPGDKARVQEILRRLESEEIRLPAGDRLTARRFRQIGAWLGDSSGWESMHHLIEQPFGSNGFLYDAQDQTRFGRNPIYATLHESSYADGMATRWSAERTLPADLDPESPFTGEHIFPWMWDDYGALHTHKAAADILAEHPWPRLYDAEQLRRNEVPVAAAVYRNDLYVEFEYSEETIEAIRGIKPWITNEYEHNGLRADGERVLSRLIDLVRGRA